METRVKNSRRKFIGTLALGAGTGLTAMGATFKDNAMKFTAGADDSEAWFKKIKGNHRVVFDASEPNNAFGIIWTWGFYATNNGPVHLTVILPRYAYSVTMQYPLHWKTPMEQVQTW